MALIPAAGTGSRTGAAVPKQYLPVAGRAMIVRTIEAFASVVRIDRIVVVIAPDDDRFERLTFDVGVAERLRVVRHGGATRHASVANGLADIADLLDPHDWILVHDAARCGVTPELIGSLLDRLQHDDVGGLLALPMDDTVKREAVHAHGGAPFVDATVDRTQLWRAQTPQMFRYRLLRDALDAASTAAIAVTDEASAVEAAGHRVTLVPGSPRNLKVTTAEDLRMMEALLRAVPGAARDAGLHGQVSTDLQTDVQNDLQTDTQTDIQTETRTAR